MSVAAAAPATRTARPPRAPAPPARRPAAPTPAPALHVVPAPPWRAPLAPFILVSVSAVVAGLLGLLLLNTLVAQDSFRVHRLERARTALLEQEQSLDSQVARLQAPAVLAQRAQGLGLVPGNTPGFLRLRDGQVTGTPAAALSPLPPQAPAASVTVAPPVTGPPPAAATKTAPTPAPRPTAQQQNGKSTAQQPVVKQPARQPVGTKPAAQRPVAKPPAGTRPAVGKAPAGPKPAAATP